MKIRNRKKKGENVAEKNDRLKEGWYIKERNRKEEEKGKEVKRRDIGKEEGVASMEEKLQKRGHCK